MATLLVVSFASLNAPHRRAYDELARRFGWSVHIVAPKSLRTRTVSKRCDPAPTGARYLLHDTDVIGGQSGRITWFRHLRRVLRAVRPDAVFLEYDPGSLVVLQAWAARPGTPIVCFTVENIERDRLRDALGHFRARRPKPALRDLGVKLLDVAGRQVSSGLACINAEGIEIFRGVRRWQQPIRLMPLGTDLELFRRKDVSDVRTSLGLAGSFVVGYFGRLVPEKGVHLLVDAIARLPDSVRLLLDMFANFEPGSYADEVMRRAAERGVRERIVTIDVPHADVPTYMNVCDVIALPSLSSERWKEQFGRVLPEAMACGVPVIGSCSGNIPSIIGEAGIIVREGSSKALADAIESVMIDDEFRHRLSVLGRERVAEKWSLHRQVEALASLLADVSGSFARNAEG